MGRFLLLVTTILILAAVQAAADGDRPAELECRLVRQAITLDGSLDEQAWTDADWRGGFRQSSPHFDRPASEETSVAFLHDEQFLYIAMRNSCTRPEEIVATRLRHRDNPWKDDFVQIILDTYQDQTRGYIFTVNPLGAREEGQVNGARRYNWDWNDVWEAEAAITPDGWQVEIRIPLKILRFSPESPHGWGVNVRRMILAKREDVYLSPPQPPHDISSLNFTVRMRGVSELHPDRNVQIKPYILAGAARGTDVEEGFQTNMGADLKYAVTNDLTLDLTAFTDFAQVEDDDQVVNLSRFSISYPEKREFFLENAQIFTMRDNGSLRPFFSRRIGIYEEETVPIDTGARLSGKLAGSDVGLMLVRTGAVDSLDLDAATYGVARARRYIDGRSWVGGLFTNSSRGDFNSTTWGVDGQWYFTEALNAYGQYVDVRRDDLDTEHDSWNAGIDYTTEPLGLSASILDVGENFDPDLGYVRRPGSQSRSFSARRTLLIHNDLVRTISTNFGSGWVDDTAGDLESRSLNLRSEVNFQDGSEIEFMVDNDFDRLDEAFELDESLIFPAGRYDFTRYEGQYRTSWSNPWQFNAGFNVGRYYDAERADFWVGYSHAVTRHLIVSGNTTSYRIDSPHGELGWQVWRGRLTYIHNAWLSIASYFQYNSSSGVASANIRLRLIHGDDSDLFIVYNERQNNDLNRWVTEARQAVIKINYRLFL